MTPLGIPACRDALRRLPGTPAHAGLLLACYLERTGDKGASKRELLPRSIAATSQAADVYRKAFDRWVGQTKGAAFRELKVHERLVIGLGGESVLETGITLHHTYGTPLLPGSALKGLASHYCDRIWGALDQEFKKVVHYSENGKEKERSGKHHKTVFGTTDDSGFIIFHDAWIKPESLRAGLVLDVMTPHHQKYYMAEGAAVPPPSDFDDPNPIQFLAVTGAFQVVLSCTSAGDVGKKWANLALDLLTQAVEHWGIGGKTNAGYGRMRAGS